VPGEVLAAVQAQSATSSDAFATLQETYLGRRQTFLANGARVGSADIEEVAEIAMQAEEVRRNSRRDRRPGRAAVAGWILSECQAVLGQTRCAERSFDGFLDDFARALPSQDILPRFQRLAQNTLFTSPAIHRPLIFRIGVFKSGQHRLSRLWRAAFNTAGKATEQFRDDPDAVEAIARSASAIAANHFPGETAEAKELAAAFLEKHPAPPIRAPEAWLAAGRLWDEQDGAERAVQAIRRAIVLAGAEARPAYWDELVQVLDHARHPASEVRTAFVQLLKRTHARDKRYMRAGGAIHLASALVREKQYAAALKWLRGYAPGDGAAQPYVEECKARLAQKKGPAGGAVPRRRQGKAGTGTHPPVVQSTQKGGT